MLTEKQQAKYSHFRKMDYLAIAMASEVTEAYVRQMLQGQHPVRSEKAKSILATADARLKTNPKPKK